MATSGTTSWTLNRDQIITSALRKLGVLQQGETPNAQQLSDGAEALNMMVREWQNDGVRLWTLAWTTQPLDWTPSVITGTDGKDYTCILSHTSNIENKPITGTDFGTFWRQRGSGGSAWANATNYYSVGDFYLLSDLIGVEKAFIRYNDSDHPVKIVSWDEYMDIPNKGMLGRPTRVLIDLDAFPRAVCHPIPEHLNYVFHYLRVRKLEDFGAAANTGDFPERWLKAVVFGLAVDLAPEYGVPIEERKRLEAKAGVFYSRAKGKDSGRSDNNFTEPAYRS